MKKIILTVVTLLATTDAFGKILDQSGWVEMNRNQKKAFAAATERGVTCKSIDTGKPSYAFNFDAETLLIEQNRWLSLMISTGNPRPSLRLIVKSNADHNVIAEFRTDDKTIGEIVAYEGHFAEVNNGSFSDPSFSEEFFISSEHRCEIVPAK